MPTRRRGSGPKGGEGRRLEPIISSARATKKMDLTMMTLRFVPAKVLTVLDLQHLVLTSNQIGKLPASIAKLKRLKSFVLSWNDLAVLPPEIGQLPSLEKLDVGFNKLVRLPPQIGNLRRLRVLVANDNQLVALPAELGNCEALREVTLQYNSLETLPPSLCSLRALTALNLAGNKWSKPLSDVIFSGIPYILEYLAKQHAGGGAPALRRRGSGAGSGAGSGGALGAVGREVGIRGGSGERPTMVHHSRGSGPHGGGDDSSSIVRDARWQHSLAAQHGDVTPRSPMARPRSSLAEEMYRHDHAADQAFLDSASPDRIMRRAREAGAAQHVRGFSPLRGSSGEDPTSPRRHDGAGAASLSQAVAAAGRRAVPFPRALVRPGLLPPGLATVSSAARTTGVAAEDTGNPVLRRRPRPSAGAAVAAAPSTRAPSAFEAAMGRLTSHPAHERNEDARIVAELLAKHGSDPTAITTLNAVLTDAESAGVASRMAARGSGVRGTRRSGSRTSRREGERGGRRRRLSNGRQHGSFTARRGVPDSTDDGVRRHGRDSADDIRRRGRDSADDIRRRGRDSADGIRRHGRDSADGIRRHGRDSADGIRRHGRDSADAGSGMRRHGRDSADAGSGRRGRSDGDGNGFANFHVDGHHTRVQGSRHTRRAGNTSRRGGSGGGREARATGAGAAAADPPPPPVASSPPSTSHSRSPQRQKGHGRTRSPSKAAGSAAPSPPKGAALGATSGSIKGINPAECAICMDGPKDTLLAPCGHVCCCHRCATRLKTRRDPCPVCRAPIENVFKVFNV